MSSPGGSLGTIDDYVRAIKMIRSTVERLGMDVKFGLDTLLSEVVQVLTSSDMLDCRLPQHAPPRWG